MEAIERIWADLQAEHARLIDAFRAGVDSMDEETARVAWQRLDEAAGIEKVMLIVGKELGL